jgi:hypothetical protein
MGKYLMLWEVDKTKTPIDPKERGAGFTFLLDMVKKDLEKGIMKDWGAFVGENNGYCVAEGNEVEIGNMTQQYIPFVFFKVYPVASKSQVDEIVSALSK